MWFVENFVLAFVEHDVLPRLIEMYSNAGVPGGALGLSKL